MTRKTETITIRMPAELAKEIEKLATQAERSMNGQIVYMLKNMLKNDIWPELPALAKLGRKD